MLDLISSLLVFVLVVTTHILWCRSFPKKDLQILVFCGMAVAGLLPLVFLLTSGSVHPSSGEELRLPLTAGSIYVLLVPVYIVFYFTTQVESPSKRLLLFLESKGLATFDELCTCMTDEAIIEPRLRDLIHTGFVLREGSSYRLVARGHRLAGVLKAYQILCGKEMGG